MNRHKNYRGSSFYVYDVNNPPKSKLYLLTYLHMSSRAAKALESFSCHETPKLGWPQDVALTLKGTLVCENSLSPLFMYVACPPYFDGSKDKYR